MVAARCIAGSKESIGIRTLLAVGSSGLVRCESISAIKSTVMPLSSEAGAR